MNDLLFYNGQIIGETGILDRGWAAVKDGVITGVGDYEQGTSEIGAGGGLQLPAAACCLDLKGEYLSPGFIDMHTHGGGGSDFMDGTVEAFTTACRMHLSHGTTSICPTSMASDDQDLFAFLDAFNRAAEVKGNMPHLLGVHLEGPYFSPAQAGAQPPHCMTKPFPGHFNRVLERAKGRIVRWSSAPEVEGVLEMGDLLQKRGILASMAHTDADYSLVLRAMDHGYRHLTHFYSGMAGLKRMDGYRVLGAVEAGYLLDGLYLEIIGDGIHLPPELLRLIFKCKDLDHIQLVTDSMRAAGMPEGPSVLGSLKNDFKVVVEDGIAKLPDRRCFAGSVATADQMIRVMVQKAGLDMWQAVRLMTRNPAQLLGIYGRTGSISQGKAADLLVFDDDVRIRKVFVDGHEIQGIIK